MRVLFAVLLVSCARKPAPAIEAERVDVGAETAAEASADASADVALPPLTHSMGLTFAGLPWTELPTSILSADARASVPPGYVAKVGWVDMAEGRRLGIVGPAMGRDPMEWSAPLRLQAFVPERTDALLSPASPAVRWSTWEAAMDTSPLPRLLVVLDAMGTPVATRFLGPTLHVREVKLFPGVATFLVEKRASGGSTSSITLDVVIFRDGELRSLGTEYNLGSHDAMMCSGVSVASAGECEIGPPGSVIARPGTPPRLRVRVVTKPCRLGDMPSGCEGEEREDVWDETAGRFVPGPAVKATLRAAYHKK